MKSIKQAAFISVEGGDGAGKTTVLSSIAQWLQAHGQSVLQTREPGGTPLAEAIRQLLLTNSDEEIDTDAELLLMLAARVQHVRQVIQPALAAGQWVISDRFLDATYAYQGGGRGIDTARIDQLHQWALPGVLPDLTILLDLPVSLAQARVVHRGEEKTRFEHEQAAFFERVRQAYLQRAQQSDDRIVVIDASQSIDAVRQAVWDVLNMRWLS